MSENRMGDFFDSHCTVLFPLGGFHAVTEDNNL